MRRPKGPTSSFGPGARVRGPSRDAATGHVTRLKFHRARAITVVARFLRALAVASRGFSSRRRARETRGTEGGNPGGYVAVFILVVILRIPSDLEFRVSPPLPPLLAHVPRAQPVIVIAAGQFVGDRLGEI